MGGSAPRREEEQDFVENLAWFTSDAAQAVTGEEDGDDDFYRVFRGDRSRRAYTWRSTSSLAPTTLDESAHVHTNDVPVGQSTVPVTQPQPTPSRGKTGERDQKQQQRGFGGFFKSLRMTKRGKGSRKGLPSAHSIGSTAWELHHGQMSEEPADAHETSNFRRAQSLQFTPDHGRDGHSHSKRDAGLRGSEPMLSSRSSSVPDGANTVRGTSFDDLLSEFLAKGSGAQPLPSAQYVSAMGAAPECAGVVRRTSSRAGTTAVRAPTPAVLGGAGAMAADSSVPNSRYVVD